MTIIRCEHCHVSQKIASVGLREPDPAEVALLLENGWQETPGGLLCPSCAARVEFYEQEDERDAYKRVGGY